MLKMIMHEIEVQPLVAHFVFLKLQPKKKHLSDNTGRNVAYDRLCCFQNNFADQRSVILWYQFALDIQIVYDKLNCLWNANKHSDWITHAEKGEQTDRQTLNHLCWDIGVSSSSIEVHNWSQSVQLVCGLLLCMVVVEIIHTHSNNQLDFIYRNDIEIHFWN